MWGCKCLRTFTMIFHLHFVRYFNSKEHHLCCCFHFIGNNWMLRGLAPKKFIELPCLNGATSDFDLPWPELLYLFFFLSDTISLYKWMFLRFILHYSISRMVKDLRCIIFVERIISAIVLHSLLSQVSKLSCWKSKYMAGNRLGLHSQTRKDQMDIVDSFRGGKVGFLFYFLI